MINHDEKLVLKNIGSLSVHREVLEVINALYLLYKVRNGL